jgi:hypothetical protein
MDNQSSTCCTSLFTLPFPEWPEYFVLLNVMAVVEFASTRKNAYCIEPGPRHVLSRELLHPIQVKSNRDQYHNKTILHPKLQYYAKFSVPGLGASAVKTKTTQCVAVSERLTEGAVPSEDDVVQTQVN